MYAQDRPGPGRGARPGGPPAAGRGSPPVERVAIAIVVEDGRVLVGRRSRPPLAGCHEFPGGRARAGEKLERAVERETLEETGVAVRIERLLVRRRHAYPHATLDLAFFVCSPRRPQRRPRGPFRWVTLDQLSSLRFPPANSPALLALRRDVRT